MTAENSNQPHILVIEDDDNISELLAFMLEREGYRVSVSSDGLKAQQFISESPAPDLIVLDLMLPFVDGFDLVKQVRSQANWEAVPVIMLSANGQDADIVHALEAGANDYVVKPFQPMVLLARIRRYL